MNKAWGTELYADNWNVENALTTKKDEGGYDRAPAKKETKLGVRNAFALVPVNLSSQGESGFG